jgi:hypothetical protein
MTHDYKRNGTTTLFAALSMLVRAPGDGDRAFRLMTTRHSNR